MSFQTKMLPSTALPSVLPSARLNWTSDVTTPRSA